MARLIIQDTDPAKASPIAPDFPPIIEFAERQTDGSHAFPGRDAFFSAAKQGRHSMETDPPQTLDDYVDAFFANKGHAQQKLDLLAKTVKASLARRGAFETADGDKPAVEIVVPRKAVFNGNLAAITLGEQVADRLTRMMPEVDWKVAYDVVYQAPITDPSKGRPAPRKHPNYAKQSLYMAASTFSEEDRSTYLVVIDDTSRFGKAFRDLDQFAKQNGKEVLAAAAFQSYVTEDLRPSASTVSAFNRAFGREGREAMDRGLAPFGLTTKALTDSEMRFFTLDPMLDVPGQSRAEAASAYLAEQAAELTPPVLLPNNDKFFRHIEAKQPLRFSQRPAAAPAVPSGP